MSRSTDVPSKYSGSCIIFQVEAEYQFQCEHPSAYHKRDSPPPVCLLPSPSSCERHRCERSASTVGGIGLASRVVQLLAFTLCLVTFEHLVTNGMGGRNRGIIARVRISHVRWIHQEQRSGSRVNCVVNRLGLLIISRPSQDSVPHGNITFLFFTIELISVLHYRAVWNLALTLQAKISKIMMPCVY